MSAGYLYAVELDNGIVKVGRTANPKARLNKLKYSHKHNHVSEFVSVRCLNFANAESKRCGKCHRAKTEKWIEVKLLMAWPRLWLHSGDNEIRRPERISQAFRGT